MGIELLFTPTYSPDLNPIELCFNKIKTELNGHYSLDVHRNLKLAVAEAVETRKGISVRYEKVLSSYGLSFSCRWLMYNSILPPKI